MNERVSESCEPSWHCGLCSFVLFVYTTSFSEAMLYEMLDIFHAIQIRRCWFFFEHIWENIGV